MAHIAAHFNAEVILVVTVYSDRYIIYLSPHFHTPSPFSPSLISLMVSVDVKHHVYLLLNALYKTISNTITGTPQKLQHGTVFFSSDK